MAQFSAVAFDKAQVTAKLARANGNDEVRAILNELTKNALDEIARDEGVEFPRAVSRMKRAEMVEILADKIIRRNEEIDNGLEFTVAGFSAITPIMEARYNKNSKADFVAEAKAKAEAKRQKAYGNISVRVVDWNAVENKKAQTANSVTTTEKEPEASTVVTTEEDYSTALVLEPDDVPSVNGESGCGAVTERNNALVALCKTPEELTALLRTATYSTLNRLFWFRVWLSRAYGRILNDGTTADKLVDVRHIKDFVDKEFERREMTSALVPVQPEDIIPVVEAFFVHDVPEADMPALEAKIVPALPAGKIPESDSEKRGRCAKLSSLLAQLNNQLQSEAEVDEKPEFKDEFRGASYQAFRETRFFANRFNARKNPRKAFPRYTTSFAPDESQQVKIKF